MQLQNKLFIAGEFVDAEGRGRIEVFNPHDNSKIADVAEARQADIDKAVAAAAKAFPAWRGIAAVDRGRLLLKLADATRAASMLRAPPPPSATSAGWLTNSKAR
jgi:aldehyde dehydrogenase (NAD+)